MSLFDTIIQFFTGSTTEEKTDYGFVADEQREKAQWLTGLKQNEETYGLTQHPSSYISIRKSRTSSSFNSSNVGGKKSARSVKLLLSMFIGIVAIYLTYEYEDGKGAKVTGGGGVDQPDKAQTSTSTIILGGQHNKRDKDNDDEESLNNRYGNRALQHRAVKQLKFIANGPNRAPKAFPLGECEGDCDNDNECEGSLVCMKRNGGEIVPGCSGIDKAHWDYCIALPTSNPSSQPSSSPSSSPSYHPSSQST